MATDERIPPFEFVLPHEVPIDAGTLDQGLLAYIAIISIAESGSLPYQANDAQAIWSFRFSNESDFRRATNELVTGAELPAVQPKKEVAGGAGLFQEPDDLRVVFATEWLAIEHGHNLELHLVSLLPDGEFSLLVAFRDSHQFSGAPLLNPYDFGMSGSYVEGSFVVTRLAGFMRSLEQLEAFVAAGSFMLNAEMEAENLGHIKVGSAAEAKQIAALSDQVGGRLIASGEDLYLRQPPTGRVDFSWTDTGIVAAARYSDRIL